MAFRLGTDGPGVSSSEPAGNDFMFGLRRRRLHLRRRIGRRLDLGRRRRRHRLRRQPQRHDPRRGRRRRGLTAAAAATSLWGGSGNDRSGRRRQRQASRRDRRRPHRRRHRHRLPLRRRRQRHAPRRRRQRLPGRRRPATSTSSLSATATTGWRISIADSDWLDLTAARDRPSTRFAKRSPTRGDGLLIDLETARGQALRRRQHLGSHGQQRPPLTRRATSPRRNFLLRRSRPPLRPALTARRRRRATSWGSAR